MNNVVWGKSAIEQVAKVLHDVGMDPVFSNGYSRATIGAIEEEFIAIFEKQSRGWASGNFDSVAFRKAVKFEEGGE